MNTEDIMKLSRKALLFKCYLLTKGKQDKYVYHVEGRSKPFQAGLKDAPGDIKDTRDWFENLEDALQHVRHSNTAKAEDAEHMLARWGAGKYPPPPSGSKKLLEHYEALRQYFDLTHAKQHAQSDAHSQHQVCNMDMICDMTCDVLVRSAMARVLDVCELYSGGKADLRRQPRDKSQQVSCSARRTSG